jgi:hypothetical protein
MGFPDGVQQLRRWRDAEASSGLAIKSAVEGWEPHLLIALKQGTQVSHRLLFAEDIVYWRQQRGERRA